MTPRADGFAWPCGDGEMEALMRAHDWAGTPVGPVERWPQSLRVAVRLLLTTRHPMFVWWGPKLIQFYNDAYARTMGPEKHPAALGGRGRDWWPEAWPIIGPQIEKVMAGEGATWHEEQPVPIHRFGAEGEVWWTYGFSPIDDPGAANGVGGVLVVCNDITEQREAAEALRKSEEKLAQTIDIARLGHWELDLASGELTASDMCKANFGVPPDRPFSYQQLRALIHPDDRDRQEQTVAEAIRTQADFRIEYRILPERDEVRWIDVRGRYEADGGEGPRLAGASQDITSRKRSEEALRESEDHYRHLVELHPQLSWTATPEGKVDSMSPKWEEWTGTDGLGDNWTVATHDDDLPEMKQKWAHSLATGVPLDSEQRIRMRDGSYCWTRTRAYPRRDAGGRIVKWYGTTEDIHQRRTAEQHQRVLLGELQHRVRNTLAVVRSIARRTADSSDSVEEMAAHLQGRLDAFSRVQAVVTRTPEGGIDLTALIEDELLAHAARDGEAVTIEGPAICLRAKPAETLSLAIHELATNAVKYGALGMPGGRIAVRWERRMRDDGEWLELSWTESGIADPVPAPAREGFGMELLRRTLPYELHAETEVAFDAGGLRFTLAMPLTNAAAR